METATESSKAVHGELPFNRLSIGGIVPCWCFEPHERI